jgi:hypothetical protein
MADLANNARHAASTTGCETSFKKEKAHKKADPTDRLFY